jgi:hypothetical protein
MSKQHLLIALVIYIASAVGSFTVFSMMGKKTAQADQAATGGDGGKAGTTALGSLLTINPSEPKNAPCPLNGKMYTKTEQNAWEKRRPLYVMIENTPDARPQSGMGKADVVFEAIAEGGVTRFGALFYCGVQADDTTLAPIRSARTYFIDWASGYNQPLYVHVGGANLPGPADALGQISDYGWNQQTDLNQFSIGYPTFVRDYNRVPGKEIATEHTMVTSTEKLWKVAEKRGWTNLSPERKVGKTVIKPEDWKAGFTGWKFEDSPEKVGAASEISYEFWSGYKDYGVKWQYDAAKNAYGRLIAGEKHVDLNDDQQVMASNVVVLFATEKGPIDEKKHMLYGTTGKGDALIFKDGGVIKATWTKKDREAELQFADAKGKDILFARGMTWISVVSTGTEVAY